MSTKTLTLLLLITLSNFVISGDPSLCLGVDTNMQEPRPLTLENPAQLAKLKGMDPEFLKTMGQKKPGKGTYVCKRCYEY